MVEPSLEKLRQLMSLPRWTKSRILREEAKRDRPKIDNVEPILEKLRNEKELPMLV
jgi:hypothetical protein